MKHVFLNNQDNNPNKSRRDLLIDEINSTRESMKERVEKQNSTLSVMNIRDYIDTFLLQHMGFDFTDSDNENSHDDIARWVDFAGSPFSEVYLVNDQDEVLLKVPSIIPSEVLEIDDKETSLEELEDYGKSIDNVSFSSKMMHSSRIEDNYKEAAQELRTNSYGEIINSISKERIEAHKQKWRDFFNQFGVLDANAIKEEMSKTLDKETLDKLNKDGNGFTTKESIVEKKDTLDVVIEEERRY